MVAVGVGVLVAPGICVGVTVGVFVGVFVAFGTSVGVGVLVAPGICVGVGVREFVGVMVAPGICVGVRVDVGALGPVIVLGVDETSALVVLPIAAICVALAKLMDEDLLARSFTLNEPKIPDPLNGSGWVVGVRTIFDPKRTVIVPLSIAGAAIAVGKTVPTIKSETSIAVGSYVICSSAADTVSVLVFIVMPTVVESPIFSVFVAGSKASVVPLSVAFDRIS